MSATGSERSVRSSHLCGATHLSLSLSYLCRNIGRGGILWPNEETDEEYKTHFTAELACLNCDVKYKVGSHQSAACTC